MKNISKLLSISVDTERSIITIYDMVTSDKLLDINAGTIGLSGNEDDEEIINRVVEEEYPVIEELAEEYENIINVEDVRYANKLYSVTLDYYGVNSHLVFANHEAGALEIVVGYLIENDYMGCLFAVDELEEDEIDDFIYVDASSYVNQDKHEWCYYLDPSTTYINFVK